MSLIWPMRFAPQLCHRCRQPIGDTERVEIVFDDERKPIAMQHAEPCVRQPARRT